MANVINRKKAGTKFDVVMPRGNEAEFITMALELGYEEIVFLVRDMTYSKPQLRCLESKENLLNVKTAYLLRDVQEIPKARKRFDYLFAVAERKFFESRIDFIIDSEKSDRKDSFHYRATSLNQVHAELSRVNGSTIVFGFNNLLYASYGLRYNPLPVFGRMLQNAVLVKKYSLKHSVFSMASRPEDMRSSTILDALHNVLGL
ncbi:MAG: hypothetical protein ACP5NW_02855 [Candidatus Woesearchaeota archaeon]